MSPRLAGIRNENSQGFAENEEDGRSSASEGVCCPRLKQNTQQIRFQRLNESHRLTGQGAVSREPIGGFSSGIWPNRHAQAQAATMVGAPDDVRLFDIGQLLGAAAVASSLSPIFGQSDPAR
jgi:hypothetical protein